MLVEQNRREGQYQYIAPLVFPSPDTKNTFQFIAGEHCRAASRLILERLTGSVEVNADILDDLDSQPTDTNCSWHFCRGFVESDAGASTMSERATDQFLVNLALLSDRVSHSFRSRGESLYFGHRLKGSTKTLSGIRRTGQDIVLSVRDGREISLDAAGQAATADTPGLLRKLPCVELAGHSIAFLFASDAEPECVEHITDPVAPSSDQILRCWLEALNLTRRVSEPHFQWCAVAVRHIVPVNAPPGAMVSGSQGQFPGQVYMSAVLEPIKLAEMLIHEASHQYFRVAQFTGQLADRDSTETFYSPVVGRERPVEKLLLAYHAFANVLVFMKLCGRHGLTEGGFIASNSARVADELQSLAAGLNAASSLTPLGRRMWNELKAGTGIG